MSKKFLAALLLISIVASGCANKANVTQEKTSTPAPVVAAEPPDPSLKIPTIEIMAPVQSSSPKTYEGAMYIKKAMAALGVNLDMKQTDQTTLSTISRKAPFDFNGFFLTWSNTVDRVDPTFYFYNFHSSENKDGGNNRQGYYNPEFEKLAEQQKVTLDPAKRKELVSKAQDILIKDVAILPIWYNDLDQAYNKKRLDGVTVQGGTGIFQWDSLTKLSVKTGDNVVRVAHNQDLDQLNPITSSNATDRRILDLIYDNLVKLDSDNKLVGGVAESWNIVNDTTIDVKLRAGQKFHDGTPLTTADVAYTYGLAKQKAGLGKYQPFVESIDSITVKDDLNMTFKLKTADSSLITSGFTSVPILPKHIWESQDYTKFKNEKPIGSGAFKFNYWRRGEEVRLDAVKDHYSKPKIDGLIMSVYTNPDSLMGSMDTGKADMVIPSLTPEQVAALKKNPDIQAVHTVGVGWFYFAYNLRRQPWNDLAFRQAMAYAVNIKDLVDTVAQGAALPAGAGQIISPAVKQWYNDKTQTYSYDLAKAKKILQDAGYQWDKDGSLYYPKKK